MAQAIHDAIERTGVLVAEAGTGTGKTFAYLVPALLAGGKVIISTGTKTLQDQLFDRDLPAVREALAAGASAALLKGRANYVCLYRLGARARGGAFRLARGGGAACAHRALRRVTTTGDRADLADVPEDAPVWAQATSTRENCLGQDCPDYGDCFVMRARRNALAADVVVVNHHLFFADVVLRDEGVAELLPACNTRDLRRGAPAARDRAPVLRRDRVDRAAGRARARRCALELRAAGGASPELERARQRAGEGGARPAPRVRRAPDAPGVDAGAAAARLRRLPAERCSSALRELREPLAAQAERSEGLDVLRAARRRGARRCSRGCTRTEPRRRGALGRGVRPGACSCTSRRCRRPSCSAADGGPSARLDLHLGDARGRRGLRPLHARARPRRGRSAALGEPVRLRAPGAALRAAGPAASRTTPGFTEAVVEAALPVLEASGGRAFLLFTTLRALRRAHELLRDRLSTIRCWCRATARAASCSSASARSATRCCSAASRSGKASTCAARRCRWW